MDSTSDRIKKRRTELGLTLDDVAEALGVNKSTVLRYETKEIEKLPINVIDPLSKILKVSREYLMGWVDDPEDYEEIANDEGWSIPSDFMPNADSYDRTRAYCKFKKAEEEDQAADFHKEAEADRRLLNAYHAADPKTQKAICIMLGIEE